MQEVDAGGGCSGWAQGLDAGGGCRRRMHRVDAGGCRRWMQGVDAGGGCRGWMQGVYRWTPQAGCELPTTPGPGSGEERPGGHFRQNAPRAGGAPKRISGVRRARGRRLGPQVAVSGGEAGVEAGEAHIKSITFTRGEEKERL